MSPAADTTAPPAAEATAARAGVGGARVVPRPTGKAYVVVSVDVDPAAFLSHFDAVAAAAFETSRTPVEELR